ncbi:MAG: NYN domain-containing protein [Puniceicoccales bacterium]|jgi:uncharacterized LabA/DUF88 family protein|nr:NYN domain-containing protein [Puniceicoccales bacterium]
MDSSPSAPPPPKRRTIIYIDAFNWYYGIFAERPSWKWLDVESFFQALRPDEEIIAVKFFSALVEPRLSTSPRRDRQQRYLSALRTLPRTTVVLGKYQNRTVTCRAPACGRNLQYEVGEEKKTDVNIVVHLIDDALRDRMDCAVIVSGDSDLEPAVAWVRTNHTAIKIAVYIPTLPEEAKDRRNDYYPSIGVTCRALPLDGITNHLFPASITLASGAVLERPRAWPAS